MKYAGPGIDFVIRVSKESKGYEGISLVLQW